MVGGGVVADRLQHVARDRYRFVGPDVSAPIVVLASAGPHAELAAAYVDRGVHVVSTSGSSHDVRDLLELDDRARAAGASLVVGAAVSPGLSGLLARHLAAAMSDVRRAARHRPRDGRTGMCPRAPPVVPRLGDRLARRSLDRAPGREWPRAVLVPRAGRCARQLSGRDARPVAAAPQLPGRASDQRPPVGDAPRPGHGAPADAQSAAPRGRRRRVARRGPRRRGVGRAGDRR